MFQTDQQNFEYRIACGICFQPRLRMVTGACQHRFCVQCVYDSGSGTRRTGLERCPSCQLDCAFPPSRPVIPEDMIEIQRALGVCECDSCGEEMWRHDMSDHKRTCTLSLCPTPSKCPKRKQKTPKSAEHQSRKPRRSRHATCVHEVKMLMDDLGAGVTTRSHHSRRLQCARELVGAGKVRSKRRAALHTPP